MVLVYRGRTYLRPPLDAVRARWSADRSSLVAGSARPARPLPELRLRPDRQRQRRLPRVRHDCQARGQDTMRRRRQTRGALKWAGTIVCGLSVALTLLSVRWNVVWARETWAVEVKGGICALWCGRARPAWTSPGLQVATRDTCLSCFLSSVFSGPVVGIKRGWSAAYVPLWLPFLVAGVPSLILWWRDLRVPPGHCPNCGYDLTGNVSGVCPECGTSVPDARTPKASG